LDQEFSKRWPGEFPGAFRIQLAMSTATVETASTAVVAAIAMVAATRVSAVVAAAAETVGFTVPVAGTTMAIISAMAVAVAVVTASTVVAVAVVTPVEPGTCADEDAASKVVRPIVAVGSTGVRIVAVVTVSADRRGADGSVNGTDSNSNANLRVGVARGKKQNS
jgi:hypothetical protein